MDSERLTYGPGEAANALGVGRTFIFEEIRAGRLKSFKAGKRFITAEALRQWIADREAESDA